MTKPERVVTSLGEHPALIRRENTAIIVVDQRAKAGAGGAAQINVADRSVREHPSEKQRRIKLAERRTLSVDLQNPAQSSFVERKPLLRVVLGELLRFDRKSESTLQPVSNNHHNRRAKSGKRLALRRVRLRNRVDWPRLVRTARQQPRMSADPGLLRSHRSVIVYDLQLYCIHGSPVRPRARGRRGHEARSRWAGAAEMDLRRAGVVGSDSSTRGCRAQRAGRVAYAAARHRPRAQRLSPPRSKPLGSRSGRNAMPQPSTTSIPRWSGQDHRLGRRAWLSGGSVGGLSRRAAGSRPGSIGGALRQIKNDRGVARQASPGPEKLDAGGVVRGAALGVVPLGQIQETTPGERISLFGHTADPLGQTSVELLLHDTPLNIAAQSSVLCGPGVKKARNTA